MENNLFEFEDKNCFEVEYNLKPQEITDGLKIFHKKTIYIKNCVYTIILGFIFLTYLISTIINPTAFNTFMMIISITVIVLIFYIPYKHIKSISNAASQMNDTFKIYFCEQNILFGEDNQTIIYYTDKKLKIIESDKSLLIFNSKENVFIVPFRCIEGVKLEKIKRLLKQKIQQNYMIIKN